MTDDLRRAGEGEDWAAVLRLIRNSFAYMDARIDPPSSMHQLTVAGTARAAREGEVWLIGAPVVACMFLAYRPDALYIGKVAVAVSERRKGLARLLIATAEDRARALGLARLTLQTRVELTELHIAYRALGFHIAGTAAHAGYDRPTSVLFDRQVLP